MTRNNCPACNSLDKVLKYKINNYKINECGRCHSLYVENVPALNELLEQYKKRDYYSLPEDSVKRINFENKRRARLINNLIQGGTVLDIGCARGSFLNEMKKYNYDTNGIEMSEQNAEICIANGHKVYLGDLNSYYNADAKQQFDIIACLDVIEHIPKPNEFLKKIKSMLSINGILVLSTPNFSGLVSKILSSRDPFLIPPEHLNFFTKKGLINLLSTNGLKLIKSITFGYLTEEGLNRTIVKYFPAGLNKLSFLLKPLINYSIKSLNIFNQGLELEYYLINEK